MADFEVERVGGELRRFGVAGEAAAFEVVSPFQPSGDQPEAIASLVKGVELSLIHISEPTRRS